MPIAGHCLPEICSLSFPDLPGESRETKNAIPIGRIYAMIFQYPASSLPIFPSCSVVLAIIDACFRPDMHRDRQAWQVELAIYIIALHSIFVWLCHSCERRNPSSSKVAGSQDHSLTHCLLFTVHYLLLTIHCSLFT